MSTTPNGATTEEPQDPGPRVSGEQMRDLARLRRSSYDRHIAGVAGGLARHLDIDPLIVRVALVVLVFFGGGGLLFYVACWLLVPEDTTDRATIPLDDRSRNVALWVVTAVSALTAVGNSFGPWHFPWPIAVIGLGVLAVVSKTSNRRWTPPPVPPGAPVTPRAATPPGPAAPAAPVPPPPPTYAGYQPPQRRDPRRRGPILFGFTLALAALGIGILATVDLAGADVPASAYPATVAAVCGAMLVLSAWFGRGGGLIPIGLIALVAMLGSSVVGDAHHGRTHERPTSSAAVHSTYRMGAGELTLDLTEVTDPTGLDGRTIHIDGRVGHVVVIVPDQGLDVHAEGTIDAAGETVLFGHREDGSSDRDYDGGAAATTPAVTIDADLLFGQIEFTTEAAR